MDALELIDELEDIQSVKIKEKDYKLLLITQQIEVAVIIDKNFEEIFQIASCIHPRKRSVCKKSSGKDGPFRCFFP